MYDIREVICKIPTVKIQENFDDATEQKLLTFSKTPEKHLEKNAENVSSPVKQNNWDDLMEINLIDRSLQTIRYDMENEDMLTRPASELQTPSEIEDAILRMSQELKIFQQTERSLEQMKFQEIK